MRDHARWEVRSQNVECRMQQAEECLGRAGDSGSEGVYERMRFRLNSGPSSAVKASQGLGGDTVVPPKSPRENTKRIRREHESISQAPPPWQHAGRSLANGAPSRCSPERRGSSAVSGPSEAMVAAGFRSARDGLKFDLKARRQIGGNWLLSGLSLARSISAHPVKRISNETDQKTQ